ncbi:MAG TPA: ectonucleotide pyrophosphatase/phosphodiesterase [Vicinamibacteria bacterium]|nr:ectonucleotide pyrophosphatase/phosphodiesterase [Vicinamibacteria bacterium]
MLRRLAASFFVVLTALACAPAWLWAASRAGASSDSPMVILISVDGFRADYLERLRPATLTRLAAQGVRSKGLIPQFPSKTFPNHYTLVTGLRVARHGIVSNNMVAPDIKGRFTMANREVTKDPRWWGGEPIWNTAERQGKVAGAMFWPGSETAINGRQPTYWLPFDDTMPHAARVARVLEWLDLPEGRRPSFLTLYFSDVDTAGHRYGPDSLEVREAVAKADRSIGELVAGVEARGLAARVNYVIVSDHGMAQLSRDRTIVLDDYLDPATVDVLDWSPVLALSPKDGNVDRVYAALKGRHKALEVYRNSEIPKAYGALAGHPRVPAIMGIAREGWSIASRRDLARWNQAGANSPGGAHGYDPRKKSMLGLFIATGPGLRIGQVVKPFENIHVYDLMCALLGIDPAPNDGQPEVTRGLLRPVEARPQPPN